jgi:hypothetical protein
MYSKLPPNFSFVGSVGIQTQNLAKGARRTTKTRISCARLLVVQYSTVQYSTVLYRPIRQDVSDDETQEFY